MAIRRERKVDIEVDKFHRRVRYMDVRKIKFSDTARCKVFCRKIRNKDDCIRHAGTSTHTFPIYKSNIKCEYKMENRKKKVIYLAWNAIVAT